MADVEECVNGSWEWPLLAKKAHFFVDTRALCGRWAFTGKTGQGQSMGEQPGRDDCVVCWRRAKAMIGAKEAADAQATPPTA